MPNTKINGVSFVSSRDTINRTHIDPVVNIHANYASIMPFGFIRNLEHPKVLYNWNRQMFGESKSGIKQYIHSLNKRGIEIMLKPQLWVARGEFTGLIKADHEEAWLELEQSYTKYILYFAELAEEEHVAIFCIGTELEGFIDKRPNYWKQLIKNIKKIYKGKLTYAANWNEYDRVPFWDQLDYIGIDAYFPVSDLKTPTLEDCRLGWLKHKDTIHAFSIMHDKPILFTEYGYRSVDFSGKQPWRSDRDMKEVNFEAQKNATQALLETFWGEDWFAGGFVWKWFHHPERTGGEDDSQFSPQNKPAEAIIKDWYSKY
ncbi:glycoside hydrolase family 113 [Confluentibacter sediminis]|uniref:glycoside hydrolase family 113 n=1 Tax=Confluentibacter sediminis TaxID=2219045 RepID=UPI001F1650A9|nr:glycoside hydrolase TIM-barrel-like domain-containing protein [Confluentibacter sediminis]